MKGGYFDIMSDGSVSQPRKLRWWHIIIDKQYREARRVHKRLRKDDSAMVDTGIELPGGFKMAMPPEVKAQWDLMPEALKAEVIAAMAGEIMANEARRKLND